MYTPFTIKQSPDGFVPTLLYKDNVLPCFYGAIQLRDEEPLSPNNPPKFLIYISVCVLPTCHFPKARRFIHHQYNYGIPGNYCPLFPVF